MLITSWHFPGYLIDCASEARKNDPIMNCLRALRPPRKVRISQRGFTLLELLAVIAIVAILVALLTTALNQTKARAHQIACLNNLRQLQLAWLEYANEND